MRTPFATRRSTARNAVVFSTAFALLGCSADSSPWGPLPGRNPVTIAANSNGATTQRSLGEFLAAQGMSCVIDPSTCFPILTPLPEILVWGDPGFTITGFIDYAGVAETWLRAHSGGTISLGTEVTGTVTERTLKDGRAEIHVVLHAKNALAFAGNGEYMAGDPVIFGATAQQVLAGATPTLGSATLQLKFIVAAPGLPLPDFGQIAFNPLPGEEVLQVMFQGQADGALHTGSGFAEGTLGRLSIQQVGVFHTKSPAKANDPFPAERVTLRPVGR